MSVCVYRHVSVCVCVCGSRTFFARAVVGGSLSPLLFRFFSGGLWPRRAVVRVRLVGACWKAEYSSSGTSSPLSVALVSPSKTHTHTHTQSTHTHAKTWLS